MPAVYFLWTWDKEHKQLLFKQDDHTNNSEHTSPKEEGTTHIVEMKCT